MFGFFATPTTAGAIWAGAAFSLAIGVFWFGRREGPVLASAWVAISVFVIAGLLPVVGYVRTFTPYHVHVLVVGPDGHPVQNAKVWSSATEKSKRIADGWLVDIPASARPANGSVLVWAALDPNDIKHSRAVQLGDDHHPSITVTISSDRSATIGGVVRARNGQGIDGALVSLAGQGADSVLTVEQGTFVLPADAPAGEEIQLQVAAGGYKLKNTWVTAGDQTVQIVLDPD